MIVNAFGAEGTKNPGLLFNNAFTQESITVSTAQPGFPIANALSGLTFDFWRPVTAAPAIIVANTPTPATCDCLGIAAHSLGSAGATITVQELNGGVWSTVASHEPTDDSVIMLNFPSATPEDWRVLITASTIPSIGILILGKRLVLRAGILPGYTPMQWGQRIDALGGKLMGGQHGRKRIIRMGGEARIPLSNIERFWFEENMPDFIEHYDEFNGFFYAGHPDMRPDDLAYCWRAEGGSELRPTYVEGSKHITIGMDVQFYG